MILPKPVKPEKVRKPIPRRRAQIKTRRPPGTKRREAKAAGYVDPDTWEAILAFYEYRCAYCGGLPLAMQQDHVVPIGRGGCHCAGNVVPACGICNYAKGTRVWMPRKLHPWMAKP